MSGRQKVYRFENLQKLVTRLRADLNGGNQDFVLLYAYNGTGKTRLSVAFKNAGKKITKFRLRVGARALRVNEQRLIVEKIIGDTLYFNAYTEDLFYWDNDLENDSERRLHMNAESKFFKGLKDLALDERIGFYLARYADFLFDIDYDQWTVSFRKGAAQHIKVSRGEENIFIWCLFLAICERVIDGAESYEWVKYIYIDDPITSLDDNNAIAVASDLAKLLRRAKGRLKNVVAGTEFSEGKETVVIQQVAAPIKAVVSSHHALFFNVVCNELKKDKHKKYFLHRPERGETYTLRSTDDTPFFHHVAMLAELQKAADSGKLFTFHFNMLRSILEKTATFFGRDDFSACIHGLEDSDLFARALNLLSHGKYDIYQPMEMVDDNKQLFRQILNAFLGRYEFSLPEIFGRAAKDANGVVSA